MSRNYVVREILDTIQGEGANVGSRVVLVRFSGCNARRLGLRCVSWCDTDHEGGRKYTAGELESAAALLWSKKNPGIRTVLMTGGEPGLQVDVPLIRVFHSRGWRVWIETNGTAALPPVDWVCVSPKGSEHLVVDLCDEVKVIYPGDDPERYFHLSNRRFIQPLDGEKGSMKACLEYIREHPDWRISVQMHKLLGLP